MGVWSILAAWMVSRACGWGWTGITARRVTMASLMESATSTPVDPSQAPLCGLIHWPQEFPSSTLSPTVTKPIPQRIHKVSHLNKTRQVTNVQGGYKVRYVSLRWALLRYLGWMILLECHESPAGTFSPVPTFRSIRNTQLVRDDWQIQIVDVAIFLTNLGAHVYISFTIEVKILELIKWSYRFPPIMFDCLNILSMESNLF